MGLSKHKDARLYIDLPPQYAQSAYINLNDFSSIFISLDEGDDDTLVYSIEVSNIASNNFASDNETKVSVTLFEFGSYTLSMLTEETELCLTPTQVDTINSYAADRLLKDIIGFIRCADIYEGEMVINEYILKDIVKEAMRFL